MSGKQQSLFFLHLPDLRKLCCITLSLQEEETETRGKQMKTCRELVLLYSDILASPALDSFTEITVVMAIPFFQKGIIQSYGQRCSLQLGSPQRVLPGILQYCVSYSLTTRLAPSWNKAGLYLISGKDFLTESGWRNAVSMELSTSENQLCVSVEASTVRLPPTRLEDFDIPPLVLRNFLSHPDSILKTFSNGGTLWCHVLPSMKKGQIFAISRQLPKDGPFRSYTDLRYHWHRLYGYRLPEVAEEEAVYCSVYFKLVGERWFTYPLSCIRLQPLQRCPRVDLQGALGSFMSDVRERLQSVCGYPAHVTSKPSYHTVSLCSAASAQVLSGEPVNLTTTSSIRPILTQLPAAAPRPTKPSFASQPPARPPLLQRAGAQGRGGGQGSAGGGGGVQGGGWGSQGSAGGGEGVQGGGWGSQGSAGGGEGVQGGGWGSQGSAGGGGGVQGGGWGSQGSAGGGGGVQGGGWGSQGSAGGGGGVQGGGWGSQGSAGGVEGVQGGGWGSQGSAGGGEGVQGGGCGSQGGAGGGGGVQGGGWGSSQIQSQGCGGEGERPSSTSQHLYSSSSLGYRSATSFSSSSSFMVYLSARATSSSSTTSSIASSPSVFSPLPPPSQAPVLPPPKLVPIFKNKSARRHVDVTLLRAQKQKEQRSGGGEERGRVTLPIGNNRPPPSSFSLSGLSVPSSSFKRPQGPPPAPPTIPRFTHRSANAPRPKANRIPTLSPPSRPKPGLSLSPKLHPDLESKPRPKANRIPTLSPPSRPKPGLSLSPKLHPNLESKPRPKANRIPTLSPPLRPKPGLSLSPKLHPDLESKPRPKANRIPTLSPPSRPKPGLSLSPKLHPDLESKPRPNAGLAPDSASSHNIVSDARGKVQQPSAQPPHPPQPLAPSGIPSNGGGDLLESKPKRSRSAIKDGDVEKMARVNQLSKLNAVTLLVWLKGRGVPVRARDKKEQLMLKVMSCLAEA